VEHFCRLGEPPGQYHLVGRYDVVEQLDIHRLTSRRLRDDGCMDDPGQCPTKEAHMAATKTSSGMSCVQWLIESRPPSLTWSRSSPPQPNQPPLNLTEPEHAEAAGPDDLPGRPA
jgi:hypothetical protein